MVGDEVEVVVGDEVEVVVVVVVGVEVVVVVVVEVVVGVGVGVVVEVVVVVSPENATTTDAGRSYLWPPTSEPGREITKRGRARVGNKRGRGRAACSEEGCSSIVKARGLCHMHYARWYRHGVTAKVVETEEERFWRYVTKRPDGCWVWTASLVKGYGQFKSKRESLRAHRVAYQWLVGPIPAGLEIDHLCRNRACCNPQHLEPVTRAVNAQRGDNWMRDRTHCKNGHLFDEDFRRGRYRGCRVCVGVWEAARKEKDKQKRKARS